jgi:hypothetical protein
MTLPSVARTPSLRCRLSRPNFRTPPDLAGIFPVPPADYGGVRQVLFQLDVIFHKLFTRRSSVAPAQWQAQPSRART